MHDSELMPLRPVISLDSQLWNASPVEVMQLLSL